MAARAGPAGRMSSPLLLDEMLGERIAAQLVGRGYDVLSVVSDPSLISLPDDQVLAEAARQGFCRRRGERTRQAAPGAGCHHPGSGRVFTAVIAAVRAIRFMPWLGPSGIKA